MKKFFYILVILVLFGFLNAKKLQDYPELTDGNIVDADLLRVEDMSATTGLRTKKILASTLKTYMFNSSFTLGGKLTGGAYEIEGSNFDINGGTAHLSTADCNILTVDNLELDVNTISSTDINGDINLTPNGTGEVNIADGNFNLGGSVCTATGTQLSVTDNTQTNSVFSSGSSLFFRANSATQMSS